MLQLLVRGPRLSSESLNCSVQTGKAGSEKAASSLCFGAQHGFLAAPAAAFRGPELPGVVLDSTWVFCNLFLPFPSAAFPGPEGGRAGWDIACSGTRVFSQTAASPWGPHARLPSPHQPPLTSMFPGVKVQGHLAFPIKFSWL